MMMEEHDFLDRFQAAADLGFAAVDIQFPYDHPPATVAERAAAAGVENLRRFAAHLVRKKRLKHASRPQRRYEKRSTSLMNKTSCSTP